MILDNVDLSQKLSKEEYKSSKKELSLDLLKCQLRLRDTGKKVIVLFEGWDAAGKGGAIKRITEPLDPRGYIVVQISAPTSEELEKIYLWRFWKRVPSKGKIVIFDRSWYGRVCVERVENLTPKEDWSRAYQEINNFEKNLFDDDTIILKFFIHISNEEQYKRFQERESDPLKRYKIGKEDFRNRGKWKEYLKAYEDMFELTNSVYAPWHIIPGNHKMYARIQVMKILAEKLKIELK